ncbi:SRPBCC domain-containing protein [Pirellulimonas nuda]|uniref:SRPBCC domain-containing protein n=1 Tax=Pirellulimonas nuda TaxID=2528009 RepID=UPI0018D368DE|nr:SRPBCC domain-containing protein [Pirellulimonas nuda]
MGGRYESRFRNDEEGTEFGLCGEIREIETLRKIVQDESHRLPSFEGEAAEESVVTLTFHEANEVTKVATLIEYASSEARDSALATGMTIAMEAGYRSIDELLAE